MNYSDFIYDFNLYLCERFGYRNCCSVMHNANGICVSVHVGEMDLYIRFCKHPFRPPRRRAAPALFYRQEVTPSVVPIAVRMVTNVWMTSFQIDFLSMFLFFN